MAEHLILQHSAQWLAGDVKVGDSHIRKFFLLAGTAHCTTIGPVPGETAHTQTERHGARHHAIEIQF